MDRETTRAKSELSFINITNKRVTFVSASSLMVFSLEEGKEALKLYKCTLEMKIFVFFCRRNCQNWTTP